MENNAVNANLINTTLLSPGEVKEYIFAPMIFFIRGMIWFFVGCLLCLLLVNKLFGRKKMLSCMWVMIALGIIGIIVLIATLPALPK